MNKKNLTFISLLALCVATVGGCSEKRNVSDIVLEVGNKKYTADELYSELVSNGTGSNEAFNAVLKLVVESSMETTVNIKSAADLAIRKFNQDVEANAQQNGISKQEAEKNLLKEKGFKTIDEYRRDIIYKQKLTRVTDNYWTTNKFKFFDTYMESRLPYLVKHILVKLDDNTNSNKIANNVNVSQKEAEKLFNVIDDLRKGEQFGQVAVQRSDDPGSKPTGGAYYMDTTTGFVDEFLYGTYIFDAYTTKKTRTVAEGETETYYEWGKTDKYTKLEDVGFVKEMEQAPVASEDSEIKSIADYYKNGVNFVDMELVDKLGEVANKTSTGDFHYIGYVGSDTFVTDGGLSEYDSSLHNLNSNYNAYARSIIFNRAFNKPGISVIGYNTKPEGNVPCVKFKMSESGEEKWILTTREGNPIFFVAAKGSSNDVWVHFLTIDISSLENLQEAKEYFSIVPPSEKETETAPTAEQTEETKKKITYVEQFGDGTRKKERELINQLEGYVKSFVTGGSGEEVGDENLLTCQMVLDLMKEHKISYVDKDLETAVMSYITTKKDLLKLKQDNKKMDVYEKHEEKLVTSERELIKMGIKPYECAVVLPTDAYAPINDSTSTGNLCRYVYSNEEGKGGYQVKTSFYYHTGLNVDDNSYTRITPTSNILSFVDGSEVKDKFSTWQWSYVGKPESKLELPTVENGKLKVQEGYIFDGWYDNKKCEGEPVTVADYTTSSIHNHTIYYAKISKVEGTYNINYNYRYKGTNIVAPSITRNSAADQAPNSFNYQKPDTGVEVTKNIPITAFSSDQFKVVGFGDAEGNLYEQDELKNHSIVVNGQSMSKSIEVYVYVEPNVNTIEYEYVDNGINKNTNEKEFLFDPTLEKNQYVVNKDLIVAPGFKVSKVAYYITKSSDDKDIPNKGTPGFEDSLTVGETVEISSSDIGRKIVIYVWLSPEGGNI